MTIAQATARDTDHDAAPVSPAQFRQALGHFASGVTVVTVRDGATLTGTTVSAFSSLSLDPPLVLVCLSHDSASHDLIRRAGRFAVNILSAEGEGLSRQFAGRGPDKFAGVDYRIGVSGAPLLAGAAATIECRLAAQHPGGDHTIFVGAVLAVSADDAARPLLYHRGRYNLLSS